MARTQEQGRLWHGSAQSTRDDQRRRRLLDAALELYGTVGYRAASVRELCRTAQVSTRSFYQLYTHQAELLRQLYRDLNAEVLAGFADVHVTANTPLGGTVRTLVTAALAPMLNDERKARVLEVESVGVSEVLERERRAAYREFAAEIDSAFAIFERTGYIREAPRGLTSLILVGGITEALVQRVQTPQSDRTSAEAFLDDVCQVILRVLGESESAGAA